MKCFLLTNFPAWSWSSLLFSCFFFSPSAADPAAQCPLTRRTSVYMWTREVSFFLLLKNYNHFWGGTFSVAHKRGCVQGFVINDRCCGLCSWSQACSQAIPLPLIRWCVVQQLHVSGLSQHKHMHTHKHVHSEYKGSCQLKNRRRERAREKRESWKAEQIGLLVSSERLWQLRECHCGPHSPHFSLSLS